MAHSTPWQQLLNLTETMLSAAKKNAWGLMGELQTDRQRLITTLPTARHDDAALLAQIRTVNQALEKLTGEHRRDLVKALLEEQKGRRGISAYDQVTATRH